MTSSLFLPYPVAALLITFSVWVGPLDAAETSLEHWPQFRGPHASGVASSKPTPEKWNVQTGENVAWQASVPGLAHASPILWGDRVYIATAVQPGKSELKVGLYGDIESADDQVKHQWRLMAYDKHTGKLIWDQLGHEAVPRVKRHTKASHCNSTPATDGQHIVAYFGSEGLFCFDPKGHLVWRKDLGPLDSGYYEVPSAQWGFSSSPIIHAGKVIALCDVQTNSFLAVFDITDGKEIWRTSRQDVPTWSTPALATVGSGQRILVNGWHQTGAYDFLTGKQLWTLDGGGDIPVPTPVLGNGYAFFTSGHGKFRPMRAIRPESSGDITPDNPGATNAGIVWAHPRKGNYMQTPIVVSDLLFGCLDNGVMTCFDVKTGALKFEERLGTGSEGFTASPVSDGHSLYFTSEQGTVFVVAATDRHKIVSVQHLGETCMATPAISEGALFFRTRSKLTCVRSR